jgi:hypothetical protein
LARFAQMNLPNLTTLGGEGVNCRRLADRPDRLERSENFCVTRCSREKLEGREAKLSLREWSTGGAVRDITSVDPSRPQLMNIYIEKNMLFLISLPSGGVRWGRWGENVSFQEKVANHVEIFLTDGVIFG